MINAVGRIRSAVFLYHFEDVMSLDCNQYYSVWPYGRWPCWVRRKRK
nr:MAG TPA: hypothetical protein [Caudoviricetes sp.]